jgi:TP901 family phage tail tape measure protein
MIGTQAGILNVLVTASTGQANAALRKTAVQFGATASAAEASSTKMSAAAAAAGAKTAKTMRYTALGIAGVGAAAVGMSIQFKQSMTQVYTQAGSTRGEVKKLSDQVLELAKTSIYSPKELADALYHVESVGFRGAKAMHVLNAAQKAATVGNADLGTTTYALVSALNSGIKGTENLTKTIATMDSIVGHGDMRMEDFTSSLSSGILSAGKVWGLSLRQIGAALDTMTAAGTPAQAAATRLRMTFSLLGHQSDTAAKALGSIGITQNQLGEAMSHGGLIKALEILHSHLAQSGLDVAHQGEILSEAFGGGRTSSAIMQLVKNLDEVKSRYKQISPDQTKFNNKLKAAENTPMNQLKTAWSSIQVMLIHLGNSIMPKVVHFLTRASDIITNKHLTTQEKFTKIADMAAKAFSNLAPTVAKAGATLAIDFLKAFGDAFMHSDLLGKLFLGTMFLRMFGGGALILAGGKILGGWILKGIASVITAGGVLPIAGELMSMLAFVIPGAVAAAGLASIIMSAIHGDFQGAGVKVAGAAVGAAIGAAIGFGLPGALVGAGLGAILAGSLTNIFDDPKFAKIGNVTRNGCMVRRSRLTGSHWGTT